MILTPDAGFAVTLNGIDFGTSATSVQFRLQVFNLAGVPLFDSGNKPLGPKTSPISSPIVSTDGIRLRADFSKGDTVGWDNIDFNESAIPEPSSLMLLGCGLLVLVRVVSARGSGQRHLSPRRIRL